MILMILLHIYSLLKLGYNLSFVIIIIIIIILIAQFMFLGINTFWVLLNFPKVILTLA